MRYLKKFSFPEKEAEENMWLDEKKTCYDTIYPFFVLSRNGIQKMDFAPITLLYGGNGCGKTTALNVIAEKLNLARGVSYNRSNFFENYVDMCTYELDGSLPKKSRIIVSDDVFDYMLNLRALNEGIDCKREELFEEYLDAKYSQFRMRSLDDYDELQKVNEARRLSMSNFARKNLMDSAPERSNGESGFLFFTNKIQEKCLYLLDEPENSLSLERQIQLASFIEDSARFYECQFIISTHSPVLLAMKDAKIYDLDSEGGEEKRWTELKSVRTLYDFLKEREEEFVDAMEERI